MKKSEKMYFAMLAVLDSAFDADCRLEILKELMEIRGTALFVEKRDEEKESAE